MKIKQMLKIMAVFAAAVCSACAHAENARLRVATFNIQMAPTPDAVYWPTRKDAAKELLNYYKFDVFGAQETFLHQIQYVLPEGYAFVGVGRDDGKTAGEYSPVFYNAKKIKPLKSGTFWISETPQKVSRGWDAACRRVCSWGEFKDLASGKKFFFFNTHLDHVGKTARLEGVKLIMKKVSEIAGKNTYFLTGDFNITPDNEAIRPLFESGKFRHAREFSAAKPYGPDLTFHAYSGVPLMFIDYIFTSPNVKILDYRVITDRIGKRPYQYKAEAAADGEAAHAAAPTGMKAAKPAWRARLKKQDDVDYASDHFPVAATVEF